MKENIDLNADVKELNYKIKSVITGHAVGDALGVPVEFATREELDGNPVTKMEGFGTYPYPAGCWSDDTSMSLAALDSLASGNINWDEIMQNSGKWLQDGEYTPTGEAFDAGRTCVNSLVNYFANNTKAIESGGTDEHSNGNGSLMRIHPFVLYLYSKGNLDLETIHNASSLTHAHERSKIACGIYSFVLWELLKNPQKSSVRLGLNRAMRYYNNKKENRVYENLYRRIGLVTIHFEDVDTFKKSTREDIKSSGYVVDTLEAAIWCLLNTHSYKDCVLTAVNLGDDTDTVAAIAGGLAGALYGYDAIPNEWLETLIKHEYIEDMCRRACDKWSKKNMPNEKLQVALMNNYINNLGVICDGQIESDILSKWINLVNNIYDICGLLWNKLLESETTFGNLEKTTEYKELFEVLKEVFLFVGEVNNYHLRESNSFGKLLVSYYSLKSKEMRAKDNFRLYFEKYLSRKIILQKNMPPRMLEDEEFDFKLTRNVRSKIRRHQKDAVEKSITKQTEVEFSDFVVRTYALKCIRNHPIESIDAKINILKTDGSIETEKVVAGFCKVCNCYFILEEDYQRLKRRGVLLCQQMTEEVFAKKGISIINGDELKPESLLYQSGYNVSESSGLSTRQRQEILRRVVDNGLYSVVGICSHLDWLISRNKKIKNRNMNFAIKKWSEDRNFISTYKSNQRVNVAIETIKRKTYKYK